MLKGFQQPEAVHSLWRLTASASSLPGGIDLGQWSGDRSHSQEEEAVLGERTRRGCSLPLQSPFPYLFIKTHKRGGGPPSSAPSKPPPCGSRGITALLKGEKQECVESIMGKKCEESQAWRHSPVSQLVRSPEYQDQV